jgi:drug/metabolite transporter (DMT)-like permease
MELAFLWTLGAIWGGVFLLMKLAVATLPPVTATLGRLGIAALALLLVVAPRRDDRAQLAAWAPPLLVMGILNNALPQTVISWSPSRIDSGLAAILNATLPPFTVLLAWALPPRTRVTAGALAGVVLGLLGVLVLVGPDALRGLGNSVQGQLAMLGSSFSYAYAAVYGRRFAGQSPLVASAGQPTGAILCLLPVTLLAEAPWTTHPSALSLGAMAGAGLASTALGYVLYFRILELGGPTRLSLVTYIMPLFALGWGWLVLYERLSWHAAATLILIATGILFVYGHAQAALRRFIVRAPGMRSPKDAPL